MFRTEGPDRIGSIGPLARRIAARTSEALAEMDTQIPAAEVALVESPFTRRARARLLPGSDRTGLVYHG